MCRVWVRPSIALIFFVDIVVDIVVDVVVDESLDLDGIPAMFDTVHAFGAVHLGMFE